jgi:hypothetical protein
MDKEREGAMKRIMLAGLMVLVAAGTLFFQFLRKRWSPGR